ncbi:MAG: hypothetical protein NUV53_00255 [Patescibacteria group bacterium]|nr:hypothetical protein [Patescibacteria group bacterium]
MKKIAFKTYEQIKNLLRITGYLFWWIIPFALFILATYLPKFIWNISFNDYLNFIKILVWPISALIILFFFKKVITYLFFSIDGFNFFGAKGEIKNVYDLITEKVNERFENEKREAARETEVNRLQREIETNSGRADENLKTAKEILAEWKKSNTDNKRLLEENKQLRDAIERKNQYSGNFPPVSGESELGTGNKVDNSQPVAPSNEEKI